MGQQFEKPNTFDDYYLDDFRSLVWFTIRLGASSVEEAEDVVQDVMRTVLSRWNEIDSPYAYARSAARGQIARVKTRIARRREAESRAGMLDSAQPPMPFDDDTTAVLEWLGTLPPAQREVLALTTDGFKPEEIARITGQKTATVRSNLRHGRQRLIRLMAEAAGRGADDGPSRQRGRGPGSASARDHRVRDDGPERPD